MPKTALYNMEGAAIGEVELSDAIFAAPVNVAAMHLVVRSILANKRQGTQSALTRGEVRGGGRKIYRQKGTGNARHHGNRAPQFKHGGVVFAPKPRDYVVNVPRKVRRLAFKSALTSKLNDGDIIVIDALKLDEAKTKLMVKSLGNFELTKNTMLVLPGRDENVVRAGNNLQQLQTLYVNTLNVYDILKAGKIILASDQPDGGLALTGDKALLFHPDDNAFLMYARRGRSLVALYDPIGPPQQRAELIWQFRDLCDTVHARPVFYQVRAENLPFYMDIGLTAIKLGEEARVDLHRFDLEAKGKEMKDLRYTWNRGTRDGLSLEIHEPGEAPMDELKVISDAWLTGKNVREKGFSLGRFSEDSIKHFRIAIIRFEGKPVAFANLLETHSHELSSLDLMRAHPDAPKLTMEFMMVGLIQHYKKHGYARFSLGMVPLSGLQPRRGAPLTQRLGSMLFQRGEHLYNFQGLRRFKDKFQPDWEPRYMAVPAGLDPLVALADTAALIAGGLTGLVKR